MRPADRAGGHGRDIAAGAFDLTLAPQSFVVLRARYSR